MKMRTMLYLILDQFVYLRQFSIDGYWDKENEVVHTSVVFVGLKKRTRRAGAPVHVTSESKSSFPTDVHIRRRGKPFDNIS